MAMLDITSYAQREYHYGPKTNAGLNCGETCVTDVIKYESGQFVNPDKICDDIYGAYYTGYSYTSDLANYLRKRGYTVVVYWGQSRSAYFRGIKSGLDKGWPSICLQVFDRFKFTGGHFVVARGYKNGYIYDCNPWGKDATYGQLGLYEWMSEEIWYRYAAGNYYIQVRAVPAGRVIEDDVAGYKGGKQVKWVSAHLLPGAAIRHHESLDAPLIYRVPPEGQGCYISDDYFVGDTWRGSNRWPVVRIDKNKVGVTAEMNIVGR